MVHSGTRSMLNGMILGFKISFQHRYTSDVKIFKKCSKQA